MKEAIKVERISKTYHGLPALKDLSLSVEYGKYSDCWAQTVQGKARVLSASLELKNLIVARYPLSV
jgi:ABC-type polar amino acid transport system ATPase subunit